ncbi:MAG: transcriptional Regulator, LysR family protein [Osedax symbiont Rs2]|nr:MAG: transcriptional Regulator, LysR family protein [Osedax symbiont Rs2]
MSRKLPPLKSLHVFESVARHLSFRRAADELHVTHSAVSHQIKLLEEALTVVLFNRNGRTISLTKDGTYLYPVVRESLYNLEEAAQHLRSSSKHKTLTIQTYVTFGSTWFIPRLGDFQKRNPNIRLRNTISFVDVDFDKDDADIGIIMGDKKWSHWNYDYLFNLEIFPICSPALLKSGRLNKPEDLKNFPLIQIDQAMDDWPLWLQAAGVDQAVCEGGPIVDNYLQAIERVYDGEALVMGRVPFVARDLREGRLVRPFTLSIPESGAWYMVTPKENRACKETALFRKWLLDQIGQDENIQIT